MISFSRTICTPFEFFYTVKNSSAAGSSKLRTQSTMWFYFKLFYYKTFESAIYLSYFG